ncbi:MAG: aerotolerance regulator BatA [candidate division Zixibacteria bacterium HGW-Zixibacteria-1]|nr:MAG: aerotolerance regulator BatA [candidate division Zixibacteria bacterium HGW-Zixibacteria-1]
MFRFAGFHITLFEQDIYIPALVIFAVCATIIALMIYFNLKKRRYHSASIKYSDLKIVKRSVRTGRQKLRFILPILRILALVLFVVAFARPQAGTENREVSSEGIDIMLALDVSGSMKAEDFKPHNRLYVAKEEIKKFVQKRTSDRIGLVIFSQSSFTQCPLTLDYGILLNFLDQVKFGMIKDGTAIGMALANCVNRLRESPSKSKVIILLTDGVNNAGQIDPLTAATIAKTMNVKIYTIGAGKPGNAMYPVDDPIFGKRYIYMPNEIDEETLQQIAQKTGGKYFRARSEKELEDIYSEIDSMEKTEIKVSEYVQYRELFSMFVMFGFGLLVLEMFLSQTVFRKIP